MDWIGLEGCTKENFETAEQVSSCAQSALGLELQIWYIHCFNTSFQFSLLKRFFDHILEVKPHIFATYNGDMFDW